MTTIKCIQGAVVLTKLDRGSFSSSRFVYIANGFIIIALEPSEQKLMSY